MSAHDRPYERVVISSILDGFVLLPVLIALDLHGELEQLLGSGIPSQQNRDTNVRRDAAMFLLESKGLVRSSDEVFTATDLGRSVFARIGAYRTVYSYDGYLRDLPDLIFNPERQIHVDRAVNVRGAGAMNKKYFKLVEQCYRSTHAKFILDIGCGDGTNLEFALACNPKLTPIGVDFEDPSLHATGERLSQLRLGASPLLFNGNVKEPEAIVDTLVAHGINPAEVLTSVWFIFHEVLAEKDLSLANLLSRYTPLAQHALLIGEIFALDAEYLAEYGQGSGAATFLFLHYLSGQLPISSTAWGAAITESGLSLMEFIPAEVMGTVCRTGIWALKA